MTDNYAQIVKNNIARLFDPIPKELAESLPAKKNNDGFVFTAFGETSQVMPDGIFLNKKNKPA